MTHHYSKNVMITSIALLLLLAGIIFWGVYALGDYSESKDITSFEACVAAGYPIMESYPRQCKRPDGTTFTESIGNELEKTNLIKITNPRPNEVVTSPLSITGEARGYWFFEASFPVELRDGNGNLLVQHYATAQGEWMTEDFVPYSSIISFTAPTTATGTLILRKDNPSGLAEHDDALFIPVRFTSTETTSVQVYFSNDDLDPQATCTAVFPVTRSVPKTQSVGKAALNELLKGPLTYELQENYKTNINTGVLLKSLTITNGTAYADFSEELDKNVGGSCRVTAIRAQIEKTLKQFPTVTAVIISVNGEVEEALQP
ncbi:MAG: GerMN domain-containing protein [Patescibacteria group bacterium]